MTIATGALIDRSGVANLNLGGRTISLDERLRTAVSEMSSEETLAAEDELDPVKIVFDIVFAEFMDKLMNGDEEETGNVTLEVDY